MSIFTLRREQFLPINIKECWDFFSDPNNLKLITPPSLGLKICSKINRELYEGMIISYKINPFPGITTTWVTEITHIKKHEYFIDEQRIGPYKFWHHQHFFKKQDNGIMAEDVVNYALPFGPIGNLLNSIYISKNLDNIFNYRENELKSIFNTNEKHNK